MSESKALKFKTELKVTFYHTDYVSNAQQMLQVLESLKKVSDWNLLHNMQNSSEEEKVEIISVETLPIE